MEGENAPLYFLKPNTMTDIYIHIYISLFIFDHLALVKKSNQLFDYKYKKHNNYSFYNQLYEHYFFLLNFLFSDKQ